MQNSDKFAIEFEAITNQSYRPIQSKSEFMNKNLEKSTVWS